MRYEIAGVSSVIIYLGDEISQKVSDTVLSCYHRLKKLPLPGLIEIVPSYASLYIEFDMFIHTHESLFELIRNIQSDNISEEANKQTDIITIPTYYDPEVGLDLVRVAEKHNLSIDEVIAIHSSTIYRVYTIGFAPGFAYMGSVPPAISTPRLATPRLKVPKGSVAIANDQCAIYPIETPGGWNILGRTYLEMFDRSIDGFSLLHPGDLVRFEPIGRDEFLRQGGRL